MKLLHIGNDDQGVYRSYEQDDGSKVNFRKVKGERKIDERKEQCRICKAPASAKHSR